MPKVLQIETSRKHTVLTVAMVSALGVAQWFLACDSAPAAPAPGTIMVAQNPPPPKCGQDPQHPAALNRTARGLSRLTRSRYI